ncbi:hypothetical protein AAVH_27477 [Aphelenchoides avenae]|nr:hypothetical protein AAVH_27477 [Aphelenchus avenae]
MPPKKAKKVKKAASTDVMTAIDVEVDVPRHWDGKQLKWVARLGSGEAAKVHLVELVGIEGKPLTFVLREEALEPAPGVGELTDGDFARVARHLANHRKCSDFRSF